MMELPNVFVAQQRKPKYGNFNRLKIGKMDHLSTGFFGIHG